MLFTGWKVRISGSIFKSEVTVFHYTDRLFKFQFMRCFHTTFVLSLSKALRGMEGLQCHAIKISNKLTQEAGI